MNQGKYIFAQLTDFLPRRTFYGIVSKHSGNKYEIIYMQEPDALHGIWATYFKR